MPIRSRFVAGGDATKQHEYPQPLMELFNRVLPMGTIIGRHELFRKHIPFFEKFTTSIEGTKISIRPAWSDYYEAPQTHVIITGHILFYHVDPTCDWYYQPSARLFSEDPRTRMSKFNNLVERALKAPVRSKTIARRLHSF